ncbi:transglycosylase SLT domain-containing protein [Brevundimonas sp.]|uniref:lytic transglycosylase domain-containing protein n=1 Tax=Brevundimonas sp. TaxID=1871086 RepID=UPI0035B052A4
MLITTLAAALAGSLAPSAQDLAPSAGPQPYAVQSQVAQTQGYQPRVLNDMDAMAFRDGLAAARSRDIPATQAAMARIGDPTARKLVQWALIDTSGSQMSYVELARFKREMAGWPRADSRISDAEIALDRAGAPPTEVIAFFDGAEPVTAQGMIALAGALEATGRSGEATELVRRWWRDQSFDAAEQSRILSRWGGQLSQADHDARLTMLLSGPHGPATQAMVNLASPTKAAAATAAMSLRGAYAPDTIVAGLSPSVAADPNVALERVKLLRSQGRQSEAWSLLSMLPPAPSHSDGQSSLWSERRNYFLDALQLNNWRGAYDSMAGHGFPGGERMVDAEFFAGWVALTKLNDPATAARHFEALRRASSTPITQGRALYWLGRAAEARGDTAAAQAFYTEGAQHIQSFYGQLAAEKAGQTSITLPGDPAPSDQDVAAFEANEVVRAMRILGETGETSLFRVFAYQLDDDVPTPAQLALLMDMANGYGEGFTAMMIGRAASQRGVLMPERQYPIRIPTAVPGAAPIEFTLAITRQESSFDPRARSSADARGMMQFLPATASGVARRLGMPYSPEMLWEPDYNMQLGSYHLAELMNNFGGSMLLATVGYNAGPGRARDWPIRCGDPRGNLVNPVDFIECAPFTETRNYMMRVMENMQIYRARLNGGTGALTLSSDLARGVSPRAGPQPYQP